LPRGFINIKYPKRILRHRLLAEASVAPRFAQTPGEIRDVSAKKRSALQHIVVFFPRDVSFALHFQGPDDQASTLKKIGFRGGYFFSMQIARLIHRRYMCRLVMLMH
jgi:hypothetical protein